MSEIFRELCRILGIENTSKTSFLSEGNAMIESTNETSEESLHKYLDSNQLEWKNCFQPVMMTYRSSVHLVKKIALPTWC